MSKLQETMDSWDMGPMRPRLPARDWLAIAAREWGLPPAGVLAILSIPFVVAAAGVIAALMGKDVYKWVTEEDQAAETLQVVCYCLAWCVSLFVIRYHFKAKRLLIATLYVGLCCGLLFLIGEEVSWGQRIFGWVTPESLESLNKQRETNLHNIHGVGHTFKWIQLLVGAYGTILPLVFLRPDRLRRYRELIEAVVPHWTLILFFLPMFLWKLARNLGPTPERFYYVITNYNEVIELILAIGFCLFLFFQLRRCQRQFGQETAAQ